MPTENRSSNTDPRDVFIRLNPLGLGENELRKDSTGFEDQRTHSDYLLFLAGYRESHPEPQPAASIGPITESSGPADQHQGSKIADALEACEWTDTPIGNKAIILSAITALRADPGEVERLRAENEAFDAGMRNLACQLSAGGYNANSLTAAQLLEKVQWGLTHLTETHARLVDSLRAQLADQEKLHGGELGLPKEGWPEYHKRKMETLRNLTAGHYERKLAERDALLRELADAPPAAMEFRLQQKVKAALSASAEPQVKS